MLVTSCGQDLLARPGAKAMTSQETTTLELSFSGMNGKDSPALVFFFF